MKSQVGVNILIVLAGLFIVVLCTLLVSRYLPEKNPVRKYAISIYRRNGILETTRLAGVVVLIAIFVALTLLYS